MSKFFGPDHLRLRGEDGAPTPVGAICMLCKQAIVDGDMGSIYPSGGIAHYECNIRAIAGSVGHQLGRCSCHGGTEEDPEGLTRLQAAKAAARVHQWKDENGLPMFPRTPIATTFRFVAAQGHLGIQCTRCGATSYNPNDLAYLYCGKCHAFHTTKGS